MGLFKRKTGGRNTEVKTYDKENQKPVLKCSICNGEQVAAFQDIHTGNHSDFSEIMNTSKEHCFEIHEKEFGVTAVIR